MTTANLTKVMGNIAVETGLNFKDLERSLNSLAEMVLDHRLALDYMLAQQGGVCAIANTSCCVYINNSGQIELRTQNILLQAKWLQTRSSEFPSVPQVWEQIKQWLPSINWFVPFLGPILVVILFLVFGPCILRLIVKFVSSHLEAVKLQMVKEMQPLMNSSVPP
jgi:hypothetical protein